MDNIRISDIMFIVITQCVNSSLKRDMSREQSHFRPLSLPFSFHPLEFAKHNLLVETFFSPILTAFSFTRNFKLSDLCLCSLLWFTFKKANLMSSHKNLKINEVVERWWNKLNWNDAKCFSIGKINEIKLLKGFTAWWYCFFLK